MSKPFAWSYSVLSSFETCPRRHNLTKVTKEVKEGQSDEMAWGNTVHKGLELRVKDGAPLSGRLEAYEPVATSILTAGIGGAIDTEQKMGLDLDFQPTGFFAGNIWARAITDVTVTKGAVSFVGDYKTGKPTPASAQLKLCAAMTFAHKPYVEKVITSFIWLAHPRPDGSPSTTNEVYTKADVPAIWQEFMPRIKRLEHALESANFPPRPSGLCRQWCPVPKRLCEHSGKV